MSREKNYNSQKELQKLENEIIKHETKLHDLNIELFSSDVINDINKIQTIQSKIDNLNNELEELNSKWEILTDEILKNKNQD
jgi:TolA-binding protein